MKKIFIFIILFAKVVVAMQVSQNIREFYKGKNVLVTGGAGFIGSHIVEKLVELDANVTVLDNLSTGNLQNLANVQNKINFISGDIRDFNTCLRALQNQEVVFHLAAFISVPESMINPLECNNVNIQGTFNILQTCKINKIKNLVFSSSSAVYGNHEGVCKEDMEFKPTSVYGFSKLMGEHYCRMYSDLFGLNTICLRYFNVYGPRQSKDGAYAAVVAKFTDCMKNNQSVTIFGDGLQTRDFVPVQKVVEANLALGMLPIENLNGQAVNIATGKSINLLELIEKLRQEFKHYDSKIIFKPARLGDVKYSFADCSKYEKLFDERI